MGRPRSAEPLSEQVLVRLTRRQLEELQAIGHLEGVSPAEVLRSLLERELDRRRDDPLMMAILDLRREAQRRASEAVVVPLRRDGR